MAVEGLSTNIIIPCNLQLDVAPFWIVNGSVYELFNIPLSLPYVIPVVDRFTGLTIPVVTLDLDEIIFQCATFNENGRTILGGGIRLRVHPGTLSYSLKILGCLSFP